MAVTTVSGCAHGSFYNSPFFLQSVSIGGVTPEPDSFLQVPQNESSCVKWPLFCSLNWRASYKAELSLPKEPELRTSCSVRKRLPLGPHLGGTPSGTAGRPSFTTSWGQETPRARVFPTARRVGVSGRPGTLPSLPRAQPFSRRGWGPGTLLEGACQSSDAPACLLGEPGGPGCGAQRGLSRWHSLPPPSDGLDTGL